MLSVRVVLAAVSLTVRVTDAHGNAATKVLRFRLPGRRVMSPPGWTR